MHSRFSSYCERLGKFIRRADRLSPPEIETEFQVLALDLFRLQFAEVPLYRRFSEARGVEPEQITRWQAIPSMPAAAFKDFELTSLMPEDRTRAFFSSGTTHQPPSRHFHNAASLHVYEQSLWPPFRRHLLSGWQGAAPRLVCLAPSPTLAPRSSLVHMFDTIRRELRAPHSCFLGLVAPDGSWELPAGDARRTLAAAASNGRPALILGTAFSFVQLLDALSESHSGSSPRRRPDRFRLPPGSRAMETGGYKGRTRALPRAELHGLLGERLGIAEDRISCEYGMSELSSQAYDHVAGTPLDSAGRTFLFPPWARSVLISPEAGEPVDEGETGLIRVFDLANVHSVMAIQTDDLGVRRGEGFALVGRAPLAQPRGCSLMAC